MADDESVRGSLRGRLPRLKDKGKHKAKIMASREALGRGESAGDIRPHTARPLSAPPFQMVEDWNANTQAELDSGKGGLLSSFKEKVQVIAQRQAQVQIEKELREVNEFRSKVAASVDEKLLDYTNQMQAANRNIATVTARLHNLSSNIGEEKIMQLLAGIVKPYFEALSGDTGRRLDAMEERSSRNEKGRMERFERELESSTERLNSLESATRKTNGIAEAKMEDVFTMAAEASTTTERQLSEVNSKFQDIKQFTESIPGMAKETQDAAERNATKLVQSAEAAAKQLIQEADDSNRSETVKLNQLRAEEVRKLERSFQSIGENAVQTIRTDMGNVTKTVKSDLGYLSDGLISTTAKQVEKVNNSVIRAKANVEFIQEHIDKADRSLDRSFKNLASEVKQLNEDVTDTMKRTHEAERKARTTIKDIDSSITSAKAGIEIAGSNLSHVKNDVERLNAKFVEDGATVLENFENGFRNMKRDSGVFLDGYVERIESKTAMAGETVADTFSKSITLAGDSLHGFVDKIQDVSNRSNEDLKRSYRDSGVFMDDYLQKFDQCTTKSQKSLDESTQKIMQNTAAAESSMGANFLRFAKETESSLGGYVDKIRETNTQSEKEQSRIHRDSSIFLGDYLQKFEQCTTSSQKSLDECTERFTQSTATAESSLATSFSRFTKETENSLEGHVHKIRDVNAQSEKELSRINRDSGVFMDDYLAKFEGSTSRANVVLSTFIQQIDQSTSNTGETLGKFVQVIEHSTAKAQETLGDYTRTIEDNASRSKETINSYAEKIEQGTIKAEEAVTRVFENMMQETGLSLSTWVDRSQGVFVQAEESIEKVFDRLSKAAEDSTQGHVMRIQETSSNAGATISSSFERLSQGTEASLGGQVAKIQEANSQAEGLLVGAFERLTKGSEESLDGRITKIRELSTQSEASLTTTFQKLTKETEESLDGHIEAIHSVTSQAGEKLRDLSSQSEASLTTAFQRLTKETEDSLDGHIGAIHSVTSEARDAVEASLAHIFQKLTKETEDSLDGHIEAIHSVTSQARDSVEASLAVTFQKLTKETEDSLDGHIEAIHNVTSQARDAVEASLAVTFQKLTKETEDSLDGHIEAIHSVTSQAGDAVLSVINGLENLKQDFVHSLDGCAENIQSAGNKIGETVMAVEQSMDKLRTETGLQMDTHVERIEKVNTNAADTMSAIALGLDKTMSACEEHFETTKDALRSTAQALEKTKNETGDSLVTFIEKVESLNTRAEERLGSAISQNLERAKVETGEYLDVCVKRIEGTSNIAGEKWALIAESWERVTRESSDSLSTCVQKFEDVSAHAGENLASIFSDGLEKTKSETGKCMDAHVTQITSVTAHAKESFAPIIQRLDEVKMETGESLEKFSAFVPELSDVVQKSLTSHETIVRTLNTEVVMRHQDLTHSMKLDMTQWSEKKDDADRNFMQQLETLAAEKHQVRWRDLEEFEQKKRDELDKALQEWNAVFDGKMGVAVESFLQRLEAHGQTVQSVALTSKEEMAERYVSTLQTCSEEREAHAKDLKNVDERLTDLDRMLNGIATEMGCSFNPFTGSDKKLPDSPIMTPGLHAPPSVTIKDRFEEASDGISELLDFCKDFRLQVNEISNDISTALGVLPPGETVSTMLETNIRTTESLSQAVGTPKKDSSLWSIMENVGESWKKNEDAYERFDTVFQETRNFISNANGALGYLPTTLEEISASATEITKSIYTSHTIAQESRTITETLSTNLQTSTQSLARCKGDFALMNEAIKKSKDLAEQSKKSAESGNTIVSDMQEILLETSKSVGEMVTTTSSVSESVEISKSTVEGFRTEVEFFKDSVLTTKESIDGSSALTGIYQEDVKAISAEFKTATERLKHITETIFTLHDSVSKVQEGMDGTKVTASETQKTIETLNGNIGDAEFSIESFTTSLSTFSKTMETTGASFGNVSAAVAEARENVKKLTEGIKGPEDLVEDLSASLTTLTEVVKATEDSIVDASDLIQDKAEEIAKAKETADPETSDSTDPEDLEEDDSSPRKEVIDKDLPALPPAHMDPIRPQSPKRPASVTDDWAIDDDPEVPDLTVVEADIDILQESSEIDNPPMTPEPRASTPQGRPRSSSNKRRRLGNFFYIPQWMSTPSPSPSTQTMQSPIPNTGTSTITGLTRQESIVDMLRRDNRNRGHGCRNGSRDGITPSMSGGLVEGPLLNSPEEAHIQDHHVPCGDCMDGVSVSQDICVTAENADVGVDTGGGLVAPDTTTETQTQTGETKVAERGRKGKTRASDDEPVYSTGQLYEGLAWQRHEILSNTMEAMTLWMHSGF